MALWAEPFNTIIVIPRCAIAHLRMPRLAQARNDARVLPDGQNGDTPVQPPLQKYFCSHLAQITSLSAAIPAHTKGRFAIVTDVGLGKRWTRHVKDE
jgi:hypothetical protein